MNIRTINKITGEEKNGYFTPSPDEQEIEDDGKTYGLRNGVVICLENDPEYIAEQERLEQEANNKDIYKQLEELDLKSIRALRSNDVKRLTDLEAQATELRKQLQ